jgi:hypothetical protein
MMSGTSQGALKWKERQRADFRGTLLGASTEETFPAISPCTSYNVPSLSFSLTRTLQLLFD